MPEKNPYLKYYTEEDFTALFLEIHGLKDEAVINYTTVIDRLHMHDLGDLAADGAGLMRISYNIPVD